MNRYCVFGALMAAVLTAAAFALPAELALEWKFDGNLNDTSGNDIHGNPYPSTVEPAFGEGVSGQALVSDGTNCVFRTGLSSAELPILGGDAWSVNVWVYPTEMPQDWRLVWALGQKPSGEVNSRSLYSSGFSATEVGHLTFVGYTPAATTWLVTHIPWDINQWQMVTTTYDGSIVRMYKNGVLIAMRAQTFQDAPGEVRIPSHAWNQHDFFIGKFDEFTIWRGKLSHEQILDMIVPGVIDDVELNRQMVYYKMDDPNKIEVPIDPTVLTDFSGYENHGEYYGFTAPLPKWFNPGFRKEGLKFDGGQTVFPPLVISQPVNYTISFWFKSGQQSYQTAFYSEKQVADVPGGYGKGSQLVIRANNDQFQAFSKERDYNSLFSFSADGSAYLTGQKWHHLALVADGEAAEARLYIDGRPLELMVGGVLMDAAPYLRSSHKTTGMVSAIGFSWPDNRFIGFDEWGAAYIDEFKMWDGALTEAQIRAVAAKGNYNNDYQVDLADFSVFAGGWREDFNVMTVIDDMEDTLDNWTVHQSQNFSGTGMISQTENAFSGDYALRWEYDLPAAAGGSNYTAFYYDFNQPQDLSIYDMLTLELYRHEGNSQEDLMFIKFLGASKQEIAETWNTDPNCVSEPAGQWEQWRINLDSLRGPQGEGSADKSDLAAVRCIMIGTGSSQRYDARSGVIDFDNLILEGLPERPLGDLDGDGKADMEDLLLFAEDWFSGID